MWKIFFTYRDKSKCTVKGKGIITPELAAKCFYRYGLHAAESIYQQYPKKDHAPVPLEEKMRELGVDTKEMKTAVLQEESLRLEKILKKIDEADETNCKKEEEYNSFCTNTREDWNEEQYQKLKKEKILTEAAYLASLVELKAEVKCMLNQ